jgi:hypothetical protein
MTAILKNNKTGLSPIFGVDPSFVIFPMISGPLAGSRTDRLVEGGVNGGCNLKGAARVEFWMS